MNNVVRFDTSQLRFCAGVDMLTLGGFPAIATLETLWQCLIRRVSIKELDIMLDE
jgi:hypothetical protein